MKRSLFARFFSLCSVIILSSIILLGIMLVTLSARYFREENLDTLQENAQHAANLVSYNYTGNAGMYINSRTIRESFNILSAASKADVFFADSSGQTAVCIDGEGCRHRTYIVEKNIMEKALGGGYRGISGLGGIYTDPMYVVGVPVTTPLGTIGVVFAGSSASGMQSFLKDVFLIFALGAILVIALSFIVTYFTTDAMVRPLKAMVSATNSFAHGDFSVRVPVEGDEEIEQLAMAFNNMATSLATTETARRSFVANVSHELKTPMTTIGGFIDGILDGTIPQDRYFHYLRIVSEEVKRLSRMVVSMLNISRIEAGEMKLEPQSVDVSKIILDTVLGFEQQIDAKNIEIIGLDNEHRTVEADPDMVHQIAYNLIENAVKFTPEGGSITIYYHNDGKSLITGIRNSGEGISKQEIPMLFDRFYKSDRSRSIDTKGVGLGLHIVKSLIHLQGGSISVRSAEGEYTEFAFSLPIGQQKSGGLFRKQEKSKS